MTEISQGERALLEQIRGGDPQGWSQLIQRYQGRLLAFAQSKLNKHAAAEDAVQDTFISFLKSLPRFRAEASLETYLFLILRRKIIDSYRARKNELPLLRDVYSSGHNPSEGGSGFARVAGDEPTASWYARQGEDSEVLREQLTRALRGLVNHYKESLNFRDLQIVELLFYCQRGNKEIGRLTGVSEQNIAVIKHRCIKNLRETLDQDKLAGVGSDTEFESLLTDLWEQLRLSCPKRSTIGAYFLKTLESPWYEYVDFHLQSLGCRFCLANLQDLKQQSDQVRFQSFQKRVLDSTIGFLHKV
jgi:RNA polymerase sigma factor (sigma-70 family)